MIEIKLNKEKSRSEAKDEKKTKTAATIGVYGRSRALVWLGSEPGASVFFLIVCVIGERCAPKFA